MSLEYKFIIKDDGSATIKKIGQDTDKLRNNLNKAEKQANDFKSSIARANIAVGNLAAQAIGKAVGMLKDFGKEMIASYDSAGKLSDTLGISASSIIGLRHAAELTNVGAEQMDKNMTRLSKSISEAASGSRQASNTFAKMGISVKNADGSVKDSKQVLMEMADAFKDMPAGAQRATLAMEVFGRAGANMVNVLKDGSDALKGMVDDGEVAAGNVEGIAESMSKLTSAGAEAKTVITGMLALFVDSDLGRGAIDYVKNLSAEWIQFSRDMKAAKEQKKEIARSNADGEKADLRILELKKAQIQHSEKSQAEKNKEIAGIAKEIASKQKKLKLDEEEIWLIHARANAIALEQKAKSGADLTGKEQELLKNYKGQVEAINAKTAAQEEAARIAAENAENERIASAKAIADFEKNQKAQEDAAKQAAKNFEDNMKRKETAIKNLVDFDERARIASLEGEEQKQAQLESNHKKQLVQLEEFYQASIFNSKDKEAATVAHNARLINLETQHQKDKEKIRKEFADKQTEDAKKLADKLAEFDDKMRIAKLEGEKQSQAQLLANYKKQADEINTLYEAQILHAENKEELQAEHYNRLLNMSAQYHHESNEIAKQFAEMEKARQEELRQQKFDAAAGTLQALQQVFEGHREFAALYKVSAIGEATINATQSVLKTMANAPYPFNIPLASAQAAAAAAKVSKIATTKMYRGGMIPSGRRHVEVNEEGQEAIFNTQAVRAIGGPPVVEALNRGTYSNTYNSNKTNNSTIVINAAVMTQKTFREEVEPVLKKASRRR
ncbi:MAG: hypothetical protein LBU89_07635 [Fibromonadaceae bacterium]|jgi:hypothetical protein|nr:hypothetical protein [Fibromonadaceae bacterium]